jgi:V/A-type H+-transporting ATPase subunit I
LESQNEFAAALAGGMEADRLFAVQGWAPVERVAHLEAGLARASARAAVSTRDPLEEERPPTLLRYPRWARPIKGLFDMLGTFPGYREIDLSPFFLVALPIFAAMLINDAGYGLVFLVLPLLFYVKMSKAMGKETTQLTLLIGGASVVWGVLTASYFGVTPPMLPAGSFWRDLTSTLGLLWDADPEVGRFLFIKVSFLMGCAHLVAGHLRQVRSIWPDARAWSEVGWSAVMLGMLGIVWMLFFEVPSPVLHAALALLAVGVLAVVLFSYPRAGPIKRIGMGFAGSLLPLINTFGDIMSYIRLMAVGLASYYIAAAFNDLGVQVAGGNSILWIVGAVVIVFGHALNIALILIAIFAHGVRLNMLEFSRSAGVEWAGYRFEPFAIPEKVTED